MGGIEVVPYILFLRCYRKFNLKKSINFDSELSINFDSELCQNQITQEE